nr:MAG TPA: hypothetical protein [Bacteriophage sp.]
MLINFIYKHLKTLSKWQKQKQKALLKSSRMCQQTT